MIGRGALAAGLAAALLAVGLTAPSAQAVTPAASLVVAPQDGGVVSRGKPLTVDVQVTNTGTVRLPAGELRYSLDQAPAASTTALLTAIAQPSTDPLGRLALTRTRTPALDPGASTTVRARITGDDLDSIFTVADGARVLYVQLRAGDVKVVRKSAAVRMSSGSPAVGFATVVPITAPAGSTGVVDTGAQATLTAGGGAWSDALDAARAMPKASVALDPAVLASVRLAGQAAPSPATGFLDDLRALPNQVLRLPYADGDVALERAAAGPVLEPSSFAGVSAADTTAPAATPAPTTATGQAADAGTLTAWDWSSTRFAWPVPNTLSGEGLAGLRDRTVLLGGADVRDSVQRQARGPLAVVNGTRTLVADATVSRLLESATHDGIDGAAAVAPLLGVLATAAATRSTPAVLGVAGRSADAAGLARVLRVLAAQRWIRGESVGDLTSQSSPPSIALVQRSVPAPRVAAARGLVEAERQVRHLSSALRDPDQVLAPERLALSGLLSAAWRTDDSGWSSAVSAGSSRFSNAATRVRILPASPLISGGSDGSLQATVQNRLAQPVRVHVAASVSNGRLRFTQRSADLTLPAGASGRAVLRFTSIANGPADVTLRLSAPDGAPIGRPVGRTVQVQAGFDTVVAVVLLLLLTALLALGVYRNVTRRRRRAPRIAR